MSETVMQLLKHSTSDMHNDAEGHDFQRRLASGDLPKKAYAAYLSQLYLIHSRLEDALRHLKSVRPEFQSAIDDIQYQEGFLKADLSELDVDLQSIKPLPPTESMLERINQLQSECPVAVIGFHYVLLGSKHGGKYIAHVLKQSYELNGAGCSYFDPYGASFSTYWKSFVESMNEQSLTEQEQAAMVDAARQMFACVTKIGGYILDMA